MGPKGVVVMIKFCRRENIVDVAHRVELSLGCCWFRWLRRSDMVQSLIRYR